MKRTIYLLLIAISLFSCKNSEKEAVVDVVPEKVEENIAVKTYPGNVNRIFEKHGGMERWNAMNNLCFEFESRGNVETHTVSLKDRKSLIESANWSIGYDGTQVWLNQKEADAYGGNARFYHNLYFYFYAMPFVLADDGINYEPVESKTLDGVKYGGVKISYGENIGDSPKDEYIVYYNQDTFDMEWLAYTVTYRSNEKSDRWSYIKYDEWMPVNGIALPKKLVWYAVEDGIPTVPRNEVVFDKVTLTETILEDSVFAKPEGATIAERE